MSLMHISLNRVKSVFIIWLIDTIIYSAYGQLENCVVEWLRNEKKYLSLNYLWSWLFIKWWLCYLVSTAGRKSGMSWSAAFGGALVWGGGWRVGAIDVKANINL